MKPTSELPYRGRTVLLLGGQVDETRSEDVGFDVLGSDEADVRIEEAVIALARAVFARGGQLALRDEPILTPLALELVLDYWQSLPGEEVGGDDRRFTGAPLLILDSEHSDYLEDVQHAIQIGCANTGTFGSQIETPPDRIVCIGGGLAVVEQVNRFNLPNSRRVPVFTIPSTGGAAGTFENTVNIRNPEQAIVKTILSRQDAMRFEPPPDVRTTQQFGGDRHLDWESSSFEPERVPQFRYSLYPLIVNFILDPDFEELPIAAP
jgi:hypothetical protein